ncbi:MAG: hypothetical protein WD557_02695 [Dehalococcoidia bacterium]
MVDADDREWFRFYIADADGSGVEARAVASLISDVAELMLVAARKRLGLPRRLGPPSGTERSLAEVRVVSVSPGSLALVFAEPRLRERQTTLGDEFVVTATADDVASDVLEEVRLAAANAPVMAGHEEVRAAAVTLLRRARAVGTTAEVSHQERTGSRTAAAIDLRSVRTPQTAPETQREVTLFGHVYMVDVELGRQRLRVKLPSESDLTMEVDPSIREKIADVLNAQAKVRVDETLRLGLVVRRMIRDVSLLLPEEQGVETPPKSLAELAATQGLLSQPVPSYTELASAVWTSKEDVLAFESYTAQVRATAS